MGKNVFGGNKSKKFARVSNSGGDRNKLRVVEEEGEEYAIVTKMVGNGCNVHCADNVVRLCIIRGKFQGKGKSMNIISAGSWLLVGLRDWETVKDKSIPKCDLLEVYNHVDKERLKSISTTVNWDILINNDVTNLDKINGISRVENIHFITEKEEDYLKTMELALKAPNAVIDTQQGQQGTIQGTKQGTIQGQQGTKQGTIQAPIVDRVYVDDI